MRQTYEVVTDDMDGSKDAEHVTFSFEGRHFEIDLSPKNRDKLLNFLTPYMEKARRYRPTTNGNGRAPRAEGRDWDLAQLRAWALRENIDLPQRGRIPGAIVAQYKAAGGR